MPVVPTKPDPKPVSPTGGTSSAPFNLDTPIKVIIADPAAKAVLDRDLADGKVSPEAAEKEYVAVVDRPGLRINRGATARRRRPQ